MAKSIRGTFTRPDTNSVWAMYVFFDTVVENISRFNDTGKITTYMKGNPDTDLTLVVDHVFSDDAFFDEYESTARLYIPSWGTPDTIDEVNAYQSETGQTLVLEDVNNPDLTGYTQIEHVTRPDGL